MSNDIIKTLDDLYLLNYEYIINYPEAEEPLSFIYLFGVEGLYNILKESRGREILFKPIDDGILDGLDYEYL